MGRIGKGANGVGNRGLRARNIGIALVCTFETAYPFGGMTLVVMAIAGKTVAVWTKRASVAVIPALETGERNIIAFGMAQTDGAQSLQILVDEA